ncbi:MAG: PQQ-binding-like beta-propeller repeat protein [Myxococcales bacterium]|nr:PQQ-binding-like beta-propeller repeat protein [Myxococcales bacterium]
MRRALVGLALVGALVLALWPRAAPPPSADDPPPVFPGRATALFVDDAHLVSGDEHGLVVVRDLDGTVRDAWVAHEAAVRRVAPLEGGWFTVSADGTVAAWSAEGRVRWRRRLPDFGLNDGVVLPDGGVVVVAERGTVARLDADGVAWRHAGVHGRAAFAVARSPAGHRVVTGGADGVVRVWDAQSGALKIEEPQRTGWVTDLLWLPAGRYALGTDNHVTLDGAPFARAPGRDPVALVPLGADLLYGCEDGTLRRIGRQLSAAHVVVDTGAPVLALAARGDHVWTGGGDGAVRQWDVTNGALLGTLPRPAPPNGEADADLR